MLSGLQIDGGILQSTEGGTTCVLGKDISDVGSVDGSAVGSIVNASYKLASL